MRSEANKNSKFQRMQGKAAIIAVVALLAIAAAVFMFVPPPSLQTPEQAAIEQSGTETAANIPAEVLDSMAAQSEIAAYADAPEETAAPQTAEERLAASSPVSTESAESIEPSSAPDAPAPDADASAEAAPRTEDAEEVESLLNAPKALTVNILRATDDRVLGRDDAPITIIEYASLTCPHCAKFHNNSLATIKRDLIDTGKVRLIFRDYPIDNYALRAAMMARCAPNEKYFDLLEVLFKNQDKWTKSDNPLRALAQYGNLAGMDDDFITACMTNAELESALLKRQRDAQTLYRIRSTPTFVFNLRGSENVRQLVGVDDPREFAEVVNKLLGMR
ncbi:MAG: thioredoxin domain-containing protein [Alphaproteobacteria bacterium]|nr:thioredoxin domain-containing protein [Alphaproteobacteria bacterium]